MWEVFTMSGSKETILREEAQKRYLNYALSVITARALPDIRDGLKPVQRRIIYSMYSDLKLGPDSRHRKSAAIVGRVIASYHPHGDQPVYEAMVRMAQDFVLRYPLVDGYGNFGSVDGDGAAAMRYTEARLTPLSIELTEELTQNTVDFKPNYDGTTLEPTVLPAKFPNLLINGSSGIAIGIATNIPPHNLSEVISALLALIDNPNMGLGELLEFIKGPDFPLGGEVIATKEELLSIYEKGRGVIKIRATYHTEPGKRGTNYIIIDSIPYMVNKSHLVEEIASLILQKKLPMVIDVRDESTDKIRIVIEYKGEADPGKIMAYLYKNSDLEIRYHYNISCLIPSKINPNVTIPQRVGLKELLNHFLEFRFNIVKRRINYQLTLLEKRIHLLEGLEKIFRNLDRVIKIILESGTQNEARSKLQTIFGLDQEQTEFIMEMKLKNLARVEQRKVLEELKEKKELRDKLVGILMDERKIWEEIKKELIEIKEKFGDKRRTVFRMEIEEVEVKKDEFMVVEDTNVVITEDGWVKRQNYIKGVETIRVREGDRILGIFPGKTTENLLLFSNLGTAYCMKIGDIPQTTGFGEPIRNFFNLKDGERIISGLSLDPRITPPDWEVNDDEIPPPYCLVVTERGNVMRFPLKNQRNLTTKVGRKYARLANNDKVLTVFLTEGEEELLLITERSNILRFPIDEVPVFEKCARGVKGIKLKEDDKVIGALLLNKKKGMEGKEDNIKLILESGEVWILPVAKIDVGKRGYKGKPIFKKVRVLGIVKPEIEIISIKDKEELPKYSTLSLKQEKEKILGEQLNIFESGRDGDDEEPI